MHADKHLILISCTYLPHLPYNHTDCSGQQREELNIDEGEGIEWVYVRETSSQHVAIAT